MTDQGTEQLKPMTFEEAVVELTRLIPSEAWSKDLPPAERKLEVSFFSGVEEIPELPSDGEAFSIPGVNLDIDSRTDILGRLNAIKQYVLFPRIVDPFLGPQCHDKLRRPFGKYLERRVESGEIDPFVLKVWESNGLAHNNMGKVETGIKNILQTLEMEYPEVYQIKNYLGDREFELRNQKKDQEADLLFEYKEEVGDTPVIKLWKKLNQSLNALTKPPFIDPKLQKETVETADKVASIGLSVLKLFEKK